MVSDLAFMALTFVIAFLGGITGTFLLHVLERRLKPRATQAEAKPKFSLRDFIAQKPTPQPKKSPIGAVPRSLGPWRLRRRELEREHNSKQKERDRRVASL